MNNENDENENNSNIDFQLLISRVPNSLRNRIFNPPRAESEQEKNLIHIIRTLHKQDFDDETIELILTQYPISRDKDIGELIKKSRLGNPSEDKLSLEFAEKFKNKLTYCPIWDKWLVWEGNYWKLDTLNRHIHHIREILRETDMPDFRRRASTVKGIEHLIKGDIDLTSESFDFDQNNNFLATPNGTIDLKKGIRRVSYQDDKITKITLVAPDAKTKIIKWLRFLLQATHRDKDYIRYLQRVCGYCLTGNTSEHALFFLYGAGGNGKGVFLNTITSILKDYAVIAPLNSFVETKNEQHSTNIAMLRGARLVTAQEVQEGKAWDEIKIKALTGGDPISAHFMQKDNFTFIPNFKLLIAGNHEPQLRNVDDATTRRFNKLPFTHKPKNPNKNLSEDLRSEYPGILQWMINGCISWQKIGLSPPKIIKETTNEYFDTQDTFSDFIEEYCEKDPDFRVTGERLLSFWYSHASRKHLRQGTEKTFKEQMLKHGFKYNKYIPRKNEKGEFIRNEKNIIQYLRGYEGIRLKPKLINPIPDETKIRS